MSQFETCAVQLGAGTHRCCAADTMFVADSFHSRSNVNSQATRKLWTQSPEQVTPCCAPFVAGALAKCTAALDTFLYVSHIEMSHIVTRPACRGG
jgi:hypothetical protein